VRETISQYAECLKRLTHQSMDIKNEEKIVEMIVSNPRFIRSAEYIANIWGKCEIKIIAELKNSVKKIAKDLELTLELDPNFGKDKSFFAFSKQGWKECIYWEFCNQGNGLLVGVNNDNNFFGRNAARLKEHLKDFGHFEDGWVIVRDFEEWTGIKSFDDKKIPAAIGEVTEELANKLDSFNFPSIPSKIDILTFPNVEQEHTEEIEILNTSAVG
jgi:hypothetical protein